MIIVRAEMADLPRLLKFRTDTASWLQVRGIDQWSNPFPSQHIAASIQRGEVFLVKEGEGPDVAATITLDQEADPLLWTEDERREPALYVHKLTVDRAHAGIRLGARMLDWAGDRAARHGARWLRLDAWTNNPRLHEYYIDLRFTPIRTVHDPEAGGSGWVAQRAASRNADHGLDDSAIGEFACER
ncbi:GNAT family N-acetyltransferase [Streptomyces malaysiensis]|uniref:GNAT family N-acetyltransferase n=1 Tax=Streptomyces malaysiensis TaxID=92644 RepID=UPI0008535165|nr:GNAT family N-acetyltransferase [Streptomyces sp. SPMA113]